MRAKSLSGKFLIFLPLARRSRRRARSRGRGRRAGERGCWRAWRLQVIPWSPPTPESYILPTLVLVLIGIYISVAASFYNSDV